MCRIRYLHSLKVSCGRGRNIIDVLELHSIVELSVPSKKYLISLCIRTQVWLLNDELIKWMSKITKRCHSMFKFDVELIIVFSSFSAVESGDTATKVMVVSWYHRYPQSLQTLLLIKILNKGS